MPGAIGSLRACVSGNAYLRGNPSTSIRSDCAKHFCARFVALQGPIVLCRDVGPEWSELCWRWQQSVRGLADDPPAQGQALVLELLDVPLGCRGRVRLRQRPGRVWEALVRPQSVAGPDEHVRGIPAAHLCPVEQVACPAHEGVGQLPELDLAVGVGWGVAGHGISLALTVSLAATRYAHAS